MTEIDPRGKVKKLLLDWCGALIDLQVNDPPNKRLDGGIFCPACGRIHGRCHEAVYPLMCAAKLTGDERYLQSAKRLFAWSENMLETDGAVRNDFDSAWKGVTVFAAIALHDALFFHGDLLSVAEKRKWERRLSGMGEWLNENLTLKTPAYLNYYAANACALELVGRYFKNENFKATAERLAEFCLEHVSESGLIFGEGSPIDAVSPKGCRPIDVGYNVEETLPCLTRYAQEAENEAMSEKCRELWRAHLDWMLPDGAWDDSAGTRSFKWTYWGSRTSDGCVSSLFSLGKDDPVFAEAAFRNLELLRSCTHEGLLTGGVDYAKNGEKTCVHHTFCHAKVLASAIDAGMAAFERVALPSDAPESVKYYPELDTLRIARGDRRMTVSGYDFIYPGSTHATDGCISLLWHKKTGALIAVGQVDLALKEPNNQQLPAHSETHRCACPRVEVVIDGRIYGQQYDLNAKLSAEEKPDETVVRVSATLTDKDGNPLSGGECLLEYSLSDSVLSISGQFPSDIAENARFVLPLIGESSKVEIFAGSLLNEPVGMFNINPGFSGKEYTIGPDLSGHFEIKIIICNTERGRK